MHPMLHAPQLAPKQMRHYFWAQHASIQHRSSGNSAAAAPAHTQLSAAQQLHASGHDDTSPSSCSVSHTLQASQLAPKQMRWIFCAGRPSISIAQAAILRLRHQHTRSSLRHSSCTHLVMMIHRQAPAQCPIRCKHPNWPRNRCAGFSAPAAHR